MAIIRDAGKYIQVEVARPGSKFHHGSQDQSLNTGHKSYHGHTATANNSSSWQKQQSYPELAVRRGQVISPGYGPSSASGNYLSDNPSQKYVCERMLKNDNFDSFLN